MQVHKLSQNKKKKQAFTLIEVIVSLGLLALIAVFIFPSLTSLMKNTGTNKNDVKIIFALEEAIEISKNGEISSFTHDVNGINVDVSIKEYQENSGFKIIEARYDKKILKLVVEK